MESLDSKLDLVLELADVHTKDISAVKESVASVQEDIEVIKLDIQFIKNDLKKKVSMDEFVALEKRVALLENRVR